MSSFSPSQSFLRSVEPSPVQNVMSVLIFLSQTKVKWLKEPYSDFWNRSQMAKVAQKLIMFLPFSNVA